MVAISIMAVASVMVVISIMAVASVMVINIMAVASVMVAISIYHGSSIHVAINTVALYPKVQKTPPPPRTCSTPCRYTGRTGARALGTEHSPATRSGPPRRLRRSFSRALATASFMHRT